MIGTLSDVPPVLLPAKLARAVVADQLATLFIPETEGEGFQTGEQRDRLDALEQRVGAVASLEIVVRDARAQMVNVMRADVAREPLQDPGSL